MAEIWRVIREDRDVNRASGGRFCLLLALYRLGNHYDERSKSGGGMEKISAIWRRKLLTIFYRPLCHSYGGYLPFAARVGRRVLFPHALYGVFISRDAVIGDDATIYHQVTIGSNPATAKNPGSPRLGNRVFLGVGACVIGNISIGDGARIGANATVVHDVPAGATVVPASARIIEAPQ